jgi:hypothetical protein
MGQKRQTSLPIDFAVGVAFCSKGKMLLHPRPRRGILDGDPSSNATMCVDNLGGSLELKLGKTF